MEKTDQKGPVPQATIDDKIFNFAYIMAMRDATQQQAFPAANKKLLWEKADETVVAYRLLKGYINDILGKDKQEQDFYEIEKDIEKAVNEFIKTNGIKKVTKKDEPEFIEDTVFTFGNAQKLINMTAQQRLTEDYTPEGNPAYTFVFKDTDGNETTAEYYEYDTNFYAAVVGDKVYLVNKMNIRDMDDAYQKIK